MTINDIAKVCHEANRAYCAALGDFSQPSWEDAPEWQKKSAVEGVDFHLKNPFAPPARAHDEWLRVKKEDGWKWGPVKNIEKKEHPCFVPYEELPMEQQRKDSLFMAIIEALYPLLKNS